MFVACLLVCGPQLSLLPSDRAWVPTLSDSFVMNRTSGHPFEVLM